jgi:hypothetical protein
MLFRRANLSPLFLYGLVLSLSAAVCSLQLNTVVISANPERYASALHVLEEVGLTLVLRHVPQPFNSHLMQAKWHSLFPTAEGNVSDADLKTLSLTKANEDVLDMIVGRTQPNDTDTWWLVFEDDIILGDEPQVVRESIFHVLALASEEGAARRAPHKEGVPTTARQRPTLTMHMKNSLTMYMQGKEETSRTIFLLYLLAA